MIRSYNFTSKWPFSRMRSKGFSFYIWGSGGWPVFAWPCFWRPQPFATVCNRLQPSATVCNRPSATVVGAKLPWRWEKSQKRDLFDVSEAVVMSFCVAGVALCDIPTCFTTRQKVVFCKAGALLLLHIQKMCCIFRGRRSTLDTSDVISRGRRSILDVSCCVFSANHIVSAARSVTRCKFRGRRDILWHVMKIDGSLARNVDFAEDP